MANVIKIWAPKVSTNEVLIKKFQIKEGLNRIVFTKCNMPDLLINSAVIKQCPMVPHGKTGAFAVPLKYFSTTQKLNQLTII